MNVSLYIAKKYFFSTKKKSFINIISIISILAVALGTFFFVIVLSVFNGFYDYIHQFENALEGEIKITATEGKTFLPDEDALAQLYSLDDAEAVTEVLEDYAFVIQYKPNGERKHKVVKLKGVGNGYEKQYDLDTMLLYGRTSLFINETPSAFIGDRIRTELQIPYDDSDSSFQRNRSVQLMYPYRKAKRIKNVNEAYVPISGSFQLGRYDAEYVLVPLEVTRTLFSYDKERTSLEVKPTSTNVIPQLQKEIRRIMGEGFDVKNKEEQNEVILKAIKLEKMIVFFILSVLFLVVSINIFFTLSMLEIEKRRDIAILFAMGGTRHRIRRIFLYQGALIAVTGATIGLVAGLGFSLLQIKFGIIKMNQVDAYPLRLQWSDFLITGVVLILITLLTSYRPAVKASNVIINERL